MVTAEITISRSELLNLKYPSEYCGIDWQTYEDISEELGESRAVHLIYKKGVLTIMPVTEIHELLTGLLHDFIRFTGIILRMNIVSTGTATLRSKRRDYGVEPDLSYYVSQADTHKIKNYVPNEIETAPDIVGEIDIYHSSDEKFEIYSEFGIAEFWRYDGEHLKMYRLQKSGGYAEIKRSAELPILTAAILTEFLKRGQTEQQFTVLADFQDWLHEQK